MDNGIIITLNGNGFKWNHVIVGWVSSVTSTAQVGACVARESAAQTVLCAAGARALVPPDRPQTPHHFHCAFSSKMQTHLYFSSEHTSSFADLF